MNSTLHILTLDEALHEINQSQVEQTDELDEILGAATAEIEREIGHYVVSRTITEYHELPCPEHEIYLKHRPIVSVTSVHEDSTGAYGASSLLTENTHFKVRQSVGSLRRISSGDRSTWLSGYVDPIKVVYVGGWAQASVPDDIKMVCREYVAMKYREITTHGQNLSSRDDEFGSVRFFGPAILTEKQKQRLQPYKSWPPNTWTSSEAA